MSKRFRATRIRFGDEVGPITDRICDECGSYVYENVAFDIELAWGLDTLFVFLCLNCDVGVPFNGCRTQTQIDERKAFTAMLYNQRIEPVDPDWEFDFSDDEEEGPQMTLFNL